MKYILTVYDLTKEQLAFFAKAMKQKEVFLPRGLEPLKMEWKQQDKNSTSFACTTRLSQSSVQYFTRHITIVFTKTYNLTVETTLSKVIEESSLKKSITFEK
jgi:hypothetical protein